MQAALEGFHRRELMEIAQKYNLLATKGELILHDTLEEQVQTL
jgi:predicted transposase YbfD/YdcC